MGLQASARLYLSIWPASLNPVYSIIVSMPFFFQIPAGFQAVLPLVVMPNVMVGAMSANRFCGRFLNVQAGANNLVSICCKFS